MVFGKKKSKAAVREGFPKQIAAALLIFVFSFVLFLSIVKATPTGPGSLGIISNETSSITNGTQINVSGGYIATLNITAQQQNPRWKGFVGNVTGTLSLDDASGSTLYDWSLTSVAGEIYATANATSPTWSQIQCTNATVLEVQNDYLNHSNQQDNITATFNNGINGSHDAFVVAGVSITADTCPTLNTYVNSASQDASFEEMALTDSTNFSASKGTIVYVTIMENDVTGFDGATYDFQMIVPDDGSDGFTGVTPYYVYVELT